MIDGQVTCSVWFDNKDRRDVFPCLKRYKLIFKLFLKKIYFMFFPKIFFGLKFLQQDGIFHKVVCVSLEYIQ
jgi:hypothetical protein